MKAIPMPINRTSAWMRLRLHGLARKVFPLKLRKAFAKNPQRSAEMSVRSQHMLYDYSRQLADGKTMKLLFGLAETASLKDKIEAMFTGKKINVTEDRAVLHTALRQRSDSPVYVDGVNVIPDVKDVLAKIKIFSNEVLAGVRKGFTDKQIKNIVAIGIGGSYLGPEYLAEACKKYAKEGIDLRFVANVDGTDFMQKTKGLKAEETLFIIVSKTFTTEETMKNAKTAKEWAQKQLGNSPDVIKKHFVAVSTAGKLVEEFGIDSKNNMFGFWDWVGGRYSATSAVGMLPLSLFLGYEKAEEILKGAAWMDNHFRSTSFEKNIPVIAGLLDVYNINFLGMHVRALLPYCQALSKLAPHTQQVEMESNGKRVDLYGRPVKFFTGEAVFGEPGTNGQHSFYQSIHHGKKIPSDFIGFTKPQYEPGRDTKEAVSHFKELMSNFVAQVDALAFGKTRAEVKADLLKKNEELPPEKRLSPVAIEALLPHKEFPGNRPSSSLLLQGELTPFMAGVLLAFTEHRTAVKGFIWDINSFDQWGVELGKELGTKIRKLYLRHNIDARTLASMADALVPSSVTMVNAINEGKLPEAEI